MNFHEELNPNPDPQLSEKTDPDPRQSGADLQYCNILPIPFLPTYQ
jgi:hypothetical protein